MYNTAGYHYDFKHCNRCRKTTVSVLETAKYFNCPLVNSQTMYFVNFVRQSKVTKDYRNEARPTRSVRLQEHLAPPTLRCSSFKQGCRIKRRPTIQSTWVAGLRFIRKPTAVQWKSFTVIEKSTFMTINPRKSRTVNDFAMMQLFTVPAAERQANALKHAPINILTQGRVPYRK